MVKLKTRDASVPAQPTSVPAERNWIPVLREEGGPMYSRLLAALQADILDGRLASGVRMPTQRELARTMGISSGTVTRAYAEAERLGLLTGQVGRGTFVNGRMPQAVKSARFVDLSLNMHNQQVPRDLFSATLARLERSGELFEQLGYGTHAGALKHREAMARLLATIGYRPPVESMLMTTGAQHSMVMALGIVCRSGDVVLTEAATFHGTKALAEFQQLNLLGVALDQEGMRPDALDKAVAESGARVVFVTPTLHNPTGRSMSEARRQEIVRIARARDLVIVEDDVYGLLGDGLPPLASLAPERTFYVSSLSKCMIPALRAGILIPPEAYLDATHRAMRATAWMGAPLGTMIAAQWIEDGTAASIIADTRDEAERRTKLARSILGEALIGTPRPSFHIWIEKPAPETAEAASYARTRGVITTPLMAPLVDPSLIFGMRLSIAAPDRIEDVEWALGVVAEAFRPHPGGRQAIM